MLLVGFSTTDSLLSWAIRTLTRSSVSHVWLLDTEGLYGTPLVLEADETGFRAVGFAGYQNKNRVVAVFRSTASLDEVRSAVIRMLGTPYDFAGLIGCLWVLLGRRLGRVWANPFEQPRALFCSEALACVLRQVRHPGAEVLIPGGTTPADLHKLLLSTAEEVPWQEL